MTDCITNSINFPGIDSRKVMYIKKSCTHSLLTLLRQRIYGIALGYEALNGHDDLRHDIAFQTAVNSTYHIASKVTPHFPYSQKLKISVFYPSFLLLGCLLIS